MKIILIDTGTTNSRLRLFDKHLNKLIDNEKIKIGVRNTAIDGNNKKLMNSLKEGIIAILSRNELDADKIEYIVASGMITSNLGVYEVPHVTGPATLNDFALSSKAVTIKEFLNIPCIFIPGMKNKTSLNIHNAVKSINEHDVMRGEEVESIGLLKQFNVEGEGVIILPGSHTKYVFIDGDRRLSSCFTTMGGEILFAIQKETILSDSINPQLVESVDEDMIKKGYEAAEEYGLTRSFFHIRLLQLFTELTANERANYFTGSVISEDIKTLLKFIEEREIKWAIIGGSNPLRNIFSYLLTGAKEEWNVIEATDEQVEYSYVYGAEEIASRKFLKINDN